MKIPLRKQFGERVKSLRLASGISQEAFADKCGFARSYMSRVERGLANPSLDAVEVLADALGVKVSELFIELSTTTAGIQVPFAKDGSYFNPSLCRPKARTFTVGEKGSEVRFDTFEAALEHLRSMPVAMWRRPNPYNVKNWGIVSAIRWGFLPENYL